MKKYSIWQKIFIYYLIAIIFTWTIAFLICSHAISAKFHYIVGYGPAIAAILSIFLIEKDYKNKISQLFVIPKPKVFWLVGTSPLWAMAILYAVLKVFGVTLPSLRGLGQVSFLGNIGLWAIPLWILTSGIGEELGWRGRLLPLLESKYSILISTIILWLFWLFWHLPFFSYLPAYQHMGVGGMIGFAFSLFSGAILLSWLYKYSGNSVPTTALWHGLFNYITASAFGSGNIAMMLSMIVICVSIIIFIYWLRPKKLKSDTICG